MRDWEVAHALAIWCTDTVSSQGSVLHSLSVESCDLACTMLVNVKRTLTCLDLVIRGGPLAFLRRGRGGGGVADSLSEEDTSLHCGGKIRRR